MHMLWNAAFRRGTSCVTALAYLESDLSIFTTTRACKFHHKQRCGILPNKNFQDTFFVVWRGPGQVWGSPGFWSIAWGGQEHL